jgi:hypothetical protein
LTNLQISVSHGATLNTFQIDEGPTGPGGVRLSGEFDRFADLASKLLQVPKSELDEEREHHKQS